MPKAKKTGLLLTIAAILLVLGLLGWFLRAIFESEPPQIALQPLSEFISERQKITISITDTKSGLKYFDVSLNQEGRLISIFEKRFPFEGLFNKRGIHTYEAEILIDPLALNLAQGRVDLVIRVWDCSRTSGGDGNMARAQHKMFVDTIPPAIRPLSRKHKIEQGGTCLVVYQASSDTVKSGVFLDDYLFPGYPANAENEKGLYVCYVAFPPDTGARPGVYLWAQDKAGNSSTSDLHFYVRRRRLQYEKINITDRYLKGIFHHFSAAAVDPHMSDMNKFRFLNSEMRQSNISLLRDLKNKTRPTQVWRGTWKKIQNVAMIGGFLDQRIYYYKGEKIDQQSRLGVDLAATRQSSVRAANRGYVVFADNLGAYGLTVVLDHGQGLLSVYAHLSAISAEMGQEVLKGAVLGLTGQTGLAIGNILHFCIMVNGVFADPQEWWDPHWIQNNIIHKLALIKK